MRSDLNFILGKVFHKKEEYEKAKSAYLAAIELNSDNYAAMFCQAKIHYLNSEFNAVVFYLNQILANPKYKDCYEVLELYAKMKVQEGKRYEALALYKRIIELNPNDYQSCFEIAQLFDQIDQSFALEYYEQGIKSK